MTDPPDPQSSTLLEIYKLHARLADRVSQRREGANRLYAGLLTAFMAFVGVILRFSVGDGSTGLVLLVTGTFGTLLSVSWCIVIQSYRQLNHRKFSALQEIEKHLPFPFFKREDEVRTRYRRLSQVETFLPVIFGLFFIGLIILSFFLQEKTE